MVFVRTLWKYLLVALHSLSHRGHNLLADAVQIKPSAGDHPVSYGKIIMS